ncbi:MAG: YARHG domain-containing protein [Clostridiaceae bacterium]
MRKNHIRCISLTTFICLIFPILLTSCRDTLKAYAVDSEYVSAQEALAIPNSNASSTEIVQAAQNNGAKAEQPSGMLQKDNITGQSAVTEPVSELIAEKPENGWQEIKSVALDNVNNSNIIVRLFGKSAENNNEIRAYIDQEGKLYSLGTVSNYGVEKVHIFQYDVTKDKAYELMVTGDVGASASVTKIIHYDSQTNTWIQLLETGYTQFIDIDHIPGTEIISTSTGSIPSSVCIYRWNGEAFERLDVSATTGNDYAYMQERYPMYWFVTGENTNGKNTEEQKYYAYTDGKLVEYPEVFVEKYFYIGDYIFPYSNVKALTDDDLERLPVNILDIARNEIYARHGYIFDNTEYSDYFKSKLWYSEDTNYSDEMLSGIERQNAAFIKQYTDKIKKYFRKIEGKTAAEDLNGDGSRDQIKLECEPGSDTFTLYINDFILNGKGCNLDGVMYLCDIDPADSYKEIAITESGPSADEATYFYYYDGKKINFMGKIQGSQYNIKITGSGMLTTGSRGHILQTWFYRDRYRLSANHELENIPQELYSMNMMVIVKKEMLLQKSPADTSTAVRLEPGEVVLIAACDDREWCLVETSSGEKGWFAVDGYNKIRGTSFDADEYFIGLCHAG